MADRFPNILLSYALTMPVAFFELRQLLSKKVSMRKDIIKDPGFIWQAGIILTLALINLFFMAQPEIFQRLKSRSWKS
jgi:hypothetical protein